MFFFGKSVEKIQVSGNLTRITGTIHEEKYIILISRLILLRIRNKKKVVGKIKTHILCPITFFFSKIVPFEIMWKSIVEAGQGTDDNMARAYCMMDI